MWLLECAVTKVFQVLHYIVRW